MTGHVEDILTKTRSAIVNHDAKISSKIRFMLPHGHMFRLQLVTQKQQNKINKAIGIYTNGEKYINWSMVGLNESLDMNTIVIIMILFLIA